MKKLCELLAEVTDLRLIGAVLHWDQQTQMPPGGAESRADQMATLRKLAHRKFTSPAIGRLIEELSGYERNLPYDSDEAALLRVSRREYTRATKIPERLVVETSRAASTGYREWLRAREARDFGIFRPHLERIVDLARQRAAALGFADRPLDAFVDIAEPGLTANRVEALFAELREGLVPLVWAIAARADLVDDTVFRGHFDPRVQLECGNAAVRAIGFDLDRRGRQALSVHPFSISFSPDDVRITTRVKEDNFAASFFALLHEAGHGLYMQGMPARFRRSVLAGGASSGAHESQSRGWENLVGRSRAFWTFFLPKAREFFPAQFGGATVDQVYRAANRVSPSLIRVEADEVTYNLHIMVRFELEKAVFDGKIAVADLAEAWVEKMRAYLGVTPPTDLEGVLQDIHWSSHFGGSFVSYTLGNVMSAQFYATARRARPGLEDGFGRGDFAPLLDWMRENVHAHGSKFTPEELLERATGAGLSVRPYLEYIRSKFTELYGL
jgi:carboxypeptidase Taq